MFQCPRLVLGHARAVPPRLALPAIVYGSSKAAVSMLTVQYADAVPDVKFNAVEPGSWPSGTG
jgi:NAD(P)-dependent dehydrogenase (short-subunit alcohol dehydrogenase family)